MMESANPFEAPLSGTASMSQGSGPIDHFVDLPVGGVSTPLVAPQRVSSPPAVAASSSSSSSSFGAVSLAAAAVRAFSPQQQPSSISSSFGNDGSATQHPTARFFHMFFKLAALIIYMCGSLIDNFVIVFVLCVLLLAFDFWTVKNVTGRLLVGLRWWNEVTDQGTRWVFESKPPTRLVHPTDSMVFWCGLYGTPIIWVLFGLASVMLFSITWLLVVIVALSLAGANIVGFWKCQRDAKEKIAGFLIQRL